LQRYGKNRHIMPNVSEYFGPNYRYGRHIGGDNYLDIHLTVTQGMLLLQPVNLEDVRRHCQERPYLCFGVPQRIGRS